MVGDTCGDYASNGWCVPWSHYDWAVNGVSVYEACGATCPEWCGESFPSIIVYPIVSVEPM